MSHGKHETSADYSAGTHIFACLAVDHSSMPWEFSKACFRFKLSNICIIMFEKFHWQSSFILRSFHPSSLPILHFIKINSFSGYSGFFFSIGFCPKDSVQRILSKGFCPKDSVQRIEFSIVIFFLNNFVVLRYQNAPPQFIQDVYWL